MLYAMDFEHLCYVHCARAYSVYQFSLMVYLHHTNFFRKK